MIPPREKTIPERTFVAVDYGPPYAAAAIAHWEGDVCVVDDMQLTSKAAAWDDISTRADEAHAVCDRVLERRPECLGRNVWHVVLEEAWAAQYLRGALWNLVQRTQAVHPEVAATTGDPEREEWRWAWETARWYLRGTPNERESPEPPTTACWDCGALVAQGEIYVSRGTEGKALCPGCYGRAEAAGRARAT